MPVPPPPPPPPLTGDSSTDAPSPGLLKTLQTVIDQANGLRQDDKDDLQNIARQLVDEMNKGNAANINKLKQLLQSINEISPNVLETLIAKLDQFKIKTSRKVSKLIESYRKE